MIAFCNLISITSHKSIDYKLNSNWKGCMIGVCKAAKSRIESVKCLKEDKLGYVIVIIMIVIIYYYLWVLSADPRPPFEPGKWWAILPMAIICIVPLLMYPAKIESDNPIFNAFLAFGISVLITPLLFGNIKLSILDSIKDKILISILRATFAVVFAAAVTYFDTEFWFYILCGIALSSFVTRFGFYAMLEGGMNKFFGVIVSFIVIIFSMRKQLIIQL